MLRAEVYLLVVVVEFQARSVCHAVEVAYYKRYRACGRDTGNAHVFVEVREDGVDGILKGVRGMDETKEGVRAF